MKTQTQNATFNATSTQTAPVRSGRRERDFGVGYGRSSGYAAERRYVNDYGMTRFRCG